MNPFNYIEKNGYFPCECMDCNGYEFFTHLYLLICPSKFLYEYILFKKNIKGRGNSYILTIPFEIIFRIRSPAKITLMLS